MTRKFFHLGSSFALFLFSGSVFAQEAPLAPTSPDPLKGLLLNLPPIIALFALFYFGMIRPQRNQQKKHAEFIDKLSRGEEVVTTSGIIGKVTGLSDRVVTLEVSQGTELKVLRTQIQGYLKDSLPVSAPASSAAKS